METTTKQQQAVGPSIAPLGALTVNLGRGKVVPVSSMREARDRVVKSIGKLGGNAWYARRGGAICSDGVPVAFVSYNGRVWSGVEDYKPGHSEIVIG